MSDNKDIEFSLREFLTYFLYKPLDKKLKDYINKIESDCSADDKEFDIVYNLKKTINLKLSENRCFEIDKNYIIVEKILSRPLLFPLPVREIAIYETDLKRNLFLTVFNDSIADRSYLISVTIEKMINDKLKKENLTVNVKLP